MQGVSKMFGLISGAGPPHQNMEKSSYEMKSAKRTLRGAAHLHLDHNSLDFCICGDTYKAQYIQLYLKIKYVCST
jgi:hypothetical protein